MATVNRWACVSLVLAAVLAAFLLSGCLDMQRADEFRGRAVSVRDRFAAESADLAAAVERMPANDPMKPDAEAALARARAKEAAADAAVQQVDLVMRRARSPDNPLSVGALGWLPEPVRWPLALGAALVASLARGAQLKRGLASVAQSLDKAMEEDGEFRARFRQHAATIRSIQTPLARREIDRAQRGRARRKAA